MTFTLREALDAVRELKALGATDIQVADIKVRFEPSDHTDAGLRELSTSEKTGVPASIHEETDPNGGAIRTLTERDLILQRIEAMRA